MTILVVGASGATGRLLVEQLLNRGQKVKVIVRSAGKLPGFIKNHKNLSIIQAGVLDLSDSEMVQHVKECDSSEKKLNLVTMFIAWRGRD